MKSIWLVSTALVAVAVVRAQGGLPASVAGGLSVGKTFSGKAMVGKTMDSPDNFSRAAGLVAVRPLGPGVATSARREGLEQDPGEMQTGRPGCTTAPDVLGAGVMQIESGFTFASDKTGSQKRQTAGIGAPLLGMGIGHGVELRVGGDGYQSHSHATGSLVERSSGVADSSFGAKIRLLKENGSRPAISLIPRLSLPTGGRVISSSSYEPAINISWSHRLPREFSAGGSLDFAATTGHEGRHMQPGASLSIGHLLPGGLVGFGEVYRVSIGGSEASTTSMFDRGATYVVGRNAQLDMSVGRDLRPSAPCWFGAVGLVLRGAGRIYEGFEGSGRR